MDPGERKSPGGWGAARPGLRPPLFGGTKRGSRNAVCPIFHGPVESPLKRAWHSCRHTASGRDDLDRLGEASQSRQTSGAARAGDHAQRDFGQPDDCIGCRDAGIAAKCKFKAAAERGAVNCDDDGLPQASMASITAGSCGSRLRPRSGMLFEGDEGGLRGSLPPWVISLLPAALEAKKRGVIFDVGHGGYSFDFTVAEVAIPQGCAPDTISSDIHVVSGNTPGMPYSPWVMSKFLVLGFSLERLSPWRQLIRQRLSIERLVSARS